MRNGLGCLLCELSALKSALKARSHHALYRDKGSQQPWPNSGRKGERAVLGGGDTFAMAWECKQKRQEDKQTRGCRSRFTRKNMSPQESIAEVWESPLLACSQIERHQAQTNNHGFIQETWKVLLTDWGRGRTPEPKPTGWCHGSRLELCKGVLEMKMTAL